MTEETKTDDGAELIGHVAAELAETEPRPNEDYGDDWVPADQLSRAAPIEPIIPPNPPNLPDAAEMLWVVLANVSGGDWSKQSPEWQYAASVWRDYYFQARNHLTYAATTEADR